MTNQERIECERNRLANLSSLRTAAHRLGDSERVLVLDRDIAATLALIAQLEAQQ
jgi:hypothetical protein